MELEFEVISRPAYSAVGMKWQGTYAQAGAGEVGKVVAKMRDRAREISAIVNPSVQMGLSYHDLPNGFTHYSVFEVNGVNDIPEGMEVISVPELKYVKVVHPKGGDIIKTYTATQAWIKENNYTPWKPAGGQFYDELPVKHELYPLETTEKIGHIILIPIVG